MKTELRLTVAAIAATLPLLCAQASQTINFGPSGPPTGTIPDGFAGFNWHGATNDEVFDNSAPVGFGSAFITEMSRPAAFDLDSMAMQTLESDAPDGGDVTSLQTTISGYLNGTLVETLTENYPWGGGNLVTLNMDGVNDIKFTTIGITTHFNMPTTQSPDLTLVTQMTVDNFVAKAPEMDPATAASALTLMVGSLLVIRGRRPKRV